MADDSRMRRSILIYVNYNRALGEQSQVAASDVHWLRNTIAQLPLTQLLSALPALLYVAI